jgi:uncharacterized protein (TIGR03083 family)
MTEARTPALDRPTAMRLAATEYDRFAAALRQLDPADWSAPTNCPGWDVRAMATHVLGMEKMAAYLRESLRQPRAAGKRGGMFIDALTGLQVEEHASLTPEQVVTELARIGPKAAKGRKRAPGIVRRRVLPAAQTDGLEPWTMGYLFDVILTRDTWMHRMDISAATGRQPELTADHDGVLVDDVVREWAGRHGEPCSVTLTGPAGGSWSFGGGGSPIEMDAVAFCRAISGRAQPAGLLETAVPF